MGDLIRLARRIFYQAFAICKGFFVCRGDWKGVTEQALPAEQPIQSPPMGEGRERRKGR